MFFVLLARVKACISRHNLLTRGQTLAVGVSGGPDSIALLHLLTRLRGDYDLKLIAAHLDHGLRPESGREAEFVARTASAWGVDSLTERVDVAALAETEHLSIEEAGRAARYRFFSRVAETVAVAHNADDQAETVLMHFLRGSGMAGLRGMVPQSRLTFDVSSLTILRPLLDIPRSDIEAYLAEHKLEFVTDATNADQTFFRNRLRHDLLPYLESYNPNIREVLRRTADVMAGDYELLRGLVEEAWEDVVILSAPEVREESVGQTLAEPETLRLRGSSSRSVSQSAPMGQGDTIKFKINRWRALPLPLQRALLREAIHRLKADERDADFTPIDHAARWAQTAQSGHTADLLGGLCLSIVGDELRVGFWKQTQTTNYQLLITQLHIPGSTTFLKHTFTASLLTAFSLAEIESNPDPYTAYLDAGLAPFVLRARRPGDRFAPLGMGGESMKLSDFMINKKIPVDQRDSWPLLCCGENAETVLWVTGYALAERGRVGVGVGVRRVVRVSSG